MKAQWLGSLKNDERENFKQAILNSQIVLDKLREMVYNMYTGKRNVTFSNYDSPSWSHEQAHTNGYCEAMQQILELLDLEPTNNKKA